MDNLSELEKKYADLINNKGLAGVIALKEQGDAGVICPPQNQTSSYGISSDEEEAYVERAKANLPAFKAKTESALRKYSQSNK